MTSLRRHRIFSGAIALVLAFAWLLASNHCVIAAVQAPAHACCQDESGQPSAPVSTQCCEAFSVPVPEHVSIPAVDLHVIALLGFVADSARPAVVPRPKASLFAHAPPGGADFLQTVLTRCVPAHAPPSFVV